MNTRQRRTLLGLTAVATGMGMFTMAAQAAPARPEAPPRVSGYTYVEKAGPRSSSASQHVSASCPRGKVVLAGGARIESGGRSVLLRGSYPANPAFGQKWTAWAQELGVGPSNGWRMHAYAICANRPPGLTLVQSTSPFRSSSFQSSVRSCPTRTKLIGLGARLIGADSKVGINSIGITSGMNASARAGKASGTSQRWAVVSYALCASPLGQAFRQTGRWISPGAFPSATVDKKCPRGTRVFGAGLLLNGSGSTLNRLIPVALHPGVSTTPPGGRATVVEQPLTLAPWSIKTQVLCAR
jgi:hypothetical protein